jgi:hypothetical protein
VPIFVPQDLEFAFVFRTDDPTHALSIARLGQVDIASGKAVSAQPYTVGVLLASSNNSTWTPIQDADLTFQIAGCKFNPTTKTIELRTIAITQVSDFLIRAALELPTEAVNAYFEVKRADGTVHRMAPFQPLPLPDFYTENVTVRVVLSGTEKVSPVLYPDVVFIAGRVRTAANYVTKAFDAGTNIRITNYFKSFTPGSSTVSTFVDKVDGVYLSLPEVSSAPLDLGWQDKKRQITGFTGAKARLRIIMTGTPANRPKVADFTAVMV